MKSINSLWENMFYIRAHQQGQTRLKLKPSCPLRGMGRGTIFTGHVSLFQCAWVLVCVWTQWSSPLLLYQSMKHLSESEGPNWSRVELSSSHPILALGLRCSIQSTGPRYQLPVQPAHGLTGCIYRSVKDTHTHTKHSTIQQKTK